MSDVERAHEAAARFIEQAQAYSVDMAADMDAVDRALTRMERELAEERAARASLEARMSRMQIYIHTIDRHAGHEPPYETCPHLDCTTTRALTEPDARALAGASTPAPVPEDGTGGAE